MMKTPFKSPRVLLLTILLFCAGGAWGSGELLKAHDNVWGQSDLHSGVFGRLCQAGSKVGMSCADGVRGRWSELSVPVLGRVVKVPVAFVGLSYFVMLGAWFVVVGGSTGVSRIWRVIPGAMAVGGLAGSLALIGLMITRRAAPCAACAAVHGVNLLAVWTIWRFFKRLRALQEENAALGCDLDAPGGVPARRLVLVALLAGLTASAGLWVYRGQHLALRDHRAKLLPYKELVTQLRNDRAFLRREFLSQKANEFTPRPGETFAPERAQLVAFVDYECPSCGCGAEDVVANARQAFGDRLEVIIRHYPLCKDCNVSVKTAFHPHACLGAWAAEAARLQGGAEAFQRMHTQLMAYGDELNESAILGLAGKAGLDVARLERDMQSEAVRQAVAADVELAGKWGVAGTPTFFLDGRRIDRRFEGPALWAALAAQQEMESPATQPAVEVNKGTGDDADAKNPPLPPLVKGGNHAGDATAAQASSQPPIAKDGSGAGENAGAENPPGPPLDKGGNADGSSGEAEAKSATEGLP